MAENIFKKIMAENFFNLGKETDIQIQEAQKVLNKINLKMSTSRHTVIKRAKNKDKKRILNSNRKVTNYR